MIISNFDLKGFSRILDSDDDEVCEKINKCQKCGQGQNFRPTFEGIKTSIECIPVLIEKLREREQPEQVIL